MTDLARRMWRICVVMLTVAQMCFTSGLALSLEELGVDRGENIKGTETMVEEAQSPEVQQLGRRIAALEQKVERRPKDFWDKLGSVSTLLSGVAVALIGFYATQVYDRRQRDAEEARKQRELIVLEVQTVEKFFPHLASSTETTKQAAIQAIASLGNAELATKLASIFGGSGSRAALSRIAAQPDVEGAKRAEAALGDLFSAIRPSVVRVQVGDRLLASEFFISASGLVATTAHVARQLNSDGKIALASGEILPVENVRVDDERDLALLQARTDEPTVPIALRPGEAELGSTVIALGQSADVSWQAVVGIVAATDVSLPSFGADRIAVNLTVRPGFSGAPVVDAQGSLVGMVQASTPDSGITYLIPAGTVQQAFGRDIAAAR